MSSKDILALDVAGAPSRWLTRREAAHYYATELVAYALGTEGFVMRGGVQSITGMRSVISVNSIIAIKGKDFSVRNYDRVPGLTKDMLLFRDRYVCAYCGSKFKSRDLEMEHVYPRSRGGQDSWMNLVTACRECNDRKAARTPEEAKMPLLYVPYIPNRHEAFILSNKTILADQMEYLLLGVPKHSRLRVAN